MEQTFTASVRQEGDWFVAQSLEEVSVQLLLRRRRRWADFL